MAARQEPQQEPDQPNIPMPTLSRPASFGVEPGTQDLLRAMSFPHQALNGGVHLSEEGVAQISGKTKLVLLVRSDGT